MTTPACSELTQDSGLPAAGTAAEAAFWVALEQPGPWGRSVWADSRLDPELGAELQKQCTRAGGRALLIRRPGERADQHAERPRQVLIAGGLRYRPWLLRGQISEPGHLLQVPFAAVAGPDPEPITAALPSLRASADPDSALLVCTNGKRDVCCAARGRPVAVRAAHGRPGRVWECSHIGGHRFAATGISLPSGQTWARLDPESAVQAVDAEARGELPAALNSLFHQRGRSCLPPALQAAEAWWRVQHGLLGLDQVGAQAAGESDGRQLVEITGQLGPARRLFVESAPGASLPGSCGKAASPTRTYRVGPA